jgi:uncharacterized membrane protein YbhN (UPF0104 family)
VILIGTFWYLIYVLFYSQDFQSLVENVQELRKTQYFLMPLVAFLMLANWGFEALKWQYLMRVVHPVSLKIATKAVLSGVSVSALLPNRIAEYLGRIFYIPPTYRVKAIIASIVGSLAQLLISVIVGSLAFIGYFYYPFEGMTINLYMMVVLFVLFNSTLLLAYFNIPTLVRILPTKGFFRKVTQYLSLIGQYDTGGLWRTLLFAFARYAIFVSQFYLLLYAFQVPLSVGEGIIVLPVVFLAQTLIPTIALAEIGVRGVTAVHFIGFFGGHSVNILAATYGLWLINILLPALIGALLMVFSRSPQTDSDAWSR